MWNADFTAMQYYVFLICASLACIHVCAQGSSVAEYQDYSCAPVAKETLACLCSCTPCEGIHAQVATHGGRGLRGGRGNWPKWTGTKGQDRPSGGKGGEAADQGREEPHGERGKLSGIGHQNGLGQVKGRGVENVPQKRMSVNFGMQGGGLGGGY